MPLARSVDGGRCVDHGFELGTSYGPGHRNSGDFVGVEQVCCPDIGNTAGPTSGEVNKRCSRYRIVAVQNRDIARCTGAADIDRVSLHVSQVIARSSLVRTSRSAATS